MATMDRVITRRYRGALGALNSSLRTHRGEWQARADFAALVETHAGRGRGLRRGGRLASLNREARRIVESLRTPGRSSE